MQRSAAYRMGASRGEIMMPPMVAQEQRLVEALVHLADTLVNDFDIFDLFYHLVESLPELVDVAGAGLLLGDPQGELHLMAVTGEKVRTLELLQIQRSEGPCFDAFATGEIVVAPFDGSAATNRWPTIAAAARQEGFGSIVAVPMRLRDNLLGSLNLFRIDHGDLKPDEIAAARGLADIASIAILQDRAAHDSAILVEQLQHALNSRVVIEQAKGVAAERLGVGVEQGFAQLRNYARNHNLTLMSVANEVISGALDPRDLRGD